METPEQYTVKTPLTLQEAKDKAARNHEFSSWDSLCKMLKRNGVYEANIGVFHDEATGIYSSELIKENERLREENKLYREALTEAKEVLQWHLDNSAPCHAIYHSDFFNLTANAITQAESTLSKFQPKKDEN